jgi:hypothetical protein
MAGFRTIGSAQVDELEGGTTIRKVTEYHCLSSPSGTYFQFRGPANAPIPVFLGDELATVIEESLADPNIQGILYSQDIAANGQLVDTYTIYWGDPAGQVTGFFSLPAGKFTVANVTGMANADTSAALGQITGG